MTTTEDVRLELLLSLLVLLTNYSSPRSPATLSTSYPLYPYKSCHDHGRITSRITFKLLNYKNFVILNMDHISFVIYFEKKMSSTNDNVITSRGIQQSESLSSSKMFLN